MPTSQRPAPMFIGDSAALDFLNSIAEPRNTEFEWLETGSDLLNWMVLSGLSTEAEIEHLRVNAHHAALEDVTLSVRKFREEFRDFIASVSEASTIPLEHPMMARINQLLAQGTQRLQVEITSDGCDAPSAVNLNSVHIYQTPQDLLFRIAAACADLICEADFQYVRNCEGPTCSMYFLDASKNHKRRWCVMEVCGNRAKAAARRERQRVKG